MTTTPLLLPATLIVNGRPIDYDAASDFFRLGAADQISVVRKAVASIDVDRELGRRPGDQVVIEPTDMIAFLAVHGIYDLMDLDEERAAGLRHVGLDTGRDLLGLPDDLHRRHPVFTRSEWQEAVGRGETELGLADWVHAQIVDVRSVFADLGFGRWYSDPEPGQERDRYRPMPDRDLTELMRPRRDEEMSIRFEDGKYLLDMHSETEVEYSSLGQAMVVGGAFVRDAHAGLPMAVADELGLDAAEWTVSTSADAVLIHHAGSDDLAIVLYEGCIHIESERDGEEVDYEDIGSALVALRETVAAEVGAPTP